MTSLLSMEDLFYGPREPTWILPSRDETPRRPFYKEREVTPPRRPLYKEREITSPRRVYRPQPPPMRYDPRPMYDEPPRRPLVTERLQPGLQPKMHTVPEVPLRTVNEVREVVNVPAEKPLIPGPPPPTQVIVEKKIAPSPKRHYVPPPIELKVPMCCEKCVKKVKDKILELPGVVDVVTDQYHQKVIVTGNADPERLLERVKRVKKRSVFWDQNVDYTQAYIARKIEDAKAEEVRAKVAQAEAAKAQAHAKAQVQAQAQAQAQAHAVQAAQAKAMVAPGPEVVVKLPQEVNGPKVTVILPADQEKNMPYEVQSRVHSQRYMSPPKAYRQEFMYNGGPEHMRMPPPPPTRGDSYYDMPHGDMRRSEHNNYYGGEQQMRPQPYKPYQHRAVY